jgi:uncharacterized protein YeaO (DUF488 family)
MKLQIKRIYEPPLPSDGMRILVDRLWPRGVKKDQASIDYWVKTLAPSNELRQWYGHDLDKWPEFQKRYRHELENQSADIEALLGLISNKTVTLVFSSKEPVCNNATAFKDYVMNTPALSGRFEKTSD